MLIMEEECELKNTQNAETATNKDTHTKYVLS